MPNGPEDVEKAVVVSSVTVGPGRHEPKIVAAREYVRLVSSGVSPAEAQAETGVGAGAGEVKKLLAQARERVKEFAAISSAERRELLLGSMTEVLVRGEFKDRISAARVLVTDPELGFQSGPVLAWVISDEVLALPGRMQFSVSRSGSAETGVTSEPLEASFSVEAAEEASEGGDENEGT